MRTRQEILRFSPSLRNLFFGLWHIFIFCLTLYAAFVIPLDVISEAHAFVQPRAFYGLLSLVYTLDIFIFLLDIKSNDRHVFVSYDIVQGYLRGWILLDILAAFPFFLFPLPGWFSLFRLLKLVKLEYLLSLIRSALIAHASKLILLSILFWLCIVAHGLSCGWLFVRGFDYDMPAMDNYIAALYWSIATITTVGYGDITAVTSTERLYTIFTMLVGYTLFAYMIGSIASLLSKSSPAKEQYHINLEKLSNAIHYADLPVDLQRKIIAYYRYIYTHNLGYDEASFIEDLPQSLKKEVSFHFRREVMEHVSIFQGADDAFFREIALHIKLHIMLPGEYVFKKGDRGENMYLISRGKVEILLEEGEEDKIVLTEGDFFGEIALFKDIPRTASVRAATYCDLYVLSRTIFDRALHRYPHIREVIEKMVNERAQHV